MSIGKYFGRAYRKPAANSIYRVCQVQGKFCIKYTVDGGEIWHFPTTPELRGTSEHQPEMQGKLDFYASAHNWQPVKDEGPVAEESSAVAAPAKEQPAAFDYTGLDEDVANDLNLAEWEYMQGKKMAEMGLRRMAGAVAIAHDALCKGVVAICDNSKHGHRGEDSFREWCASMGLKKDAAYRLLQVAQLFDSSSPNEQALLEDLSPSLLYAAAKPSAPPELVQAVKDGDITTHKQYQELLAENKRLAALADDLTADKVAAVQRAETAEKNLDVARDAETKYSHLANEASARAQKAEKRASDAEKERDGVRQALSAAKLRGDKYKEQCEALRAETPAIEARVVDTDEVERLAKEKAQAMAAEHAEQNARDAYDALVLAGRQLDAIWQTLAPRLPQLDPAQRVGAIKGLIKKLEDIEGALQCGL